MKPSSTEVGYFKRNTKNTLAQKLGQKHSNHYWFI